MKIAILTLTLGGEKKGKQLAATLVDSEHVHCRGHFAKTFKALWPLYDAFVMIMATGIVVRSLAKLLVNKREDPAVVVCDEQGRHAISLLSGHLGGGNELAHQVATAFKGQAVITTASDVLSLPALDLWAKQWGLISVDPEALTQAMGVLVNQHQIRIYSDYLLPPLPDAFVLVDEVATADLVVTSRVVSATERCCCLVPRALVLGIGCNRGTPEAEIETAVIEALAAQGLRREAVRNLASITLKVDEVGLLAFARRQGYRIDFFNRETINQVEGVESSPAVMKAIGVKGVAEPAALLSAQPGRLIVRKMKWKNVTVAIAEVSSPWSELAQVPLT